MSEENQIDFPFDGENTAPMLEVMEEPKPSFDFATPSTKTQARVQEALADKGLYLGNPSGDWGPLSIWSIQQVVHHEGDIDYDLCVAIAEYAREIGGYEGQMEGFLNEEIWVAFADAIELGDN